MFPPEVHDIDDNDLEEVVVEQDINESQKDVHNLTKVKFQQHYLLPQQICP